MLGPKRAPDSPPETPYAVIGYDLKQERADKLEAAARKGTTVTGTTQLPEFVRALKKTPQDHDAGARRQTGRRRH